MLRVREMKETINQRKSGKEIVKKSFPVVERKSSYFQGCGCGSGVQHMHDAQGSVSSNINHATKCTKDDKNNNNKTPFFITKVAAIKIGISRD